jgi:hypothetical protein
VGICVKRPVLSLVQKLKQILLTWAAGKAVGEETGFAALELRQTHMRHASPKKHTAALARSRQTQTRLASPKKKHTQAWGQCRKTSQMKHTAARERRG